MRLREFFHLTAPPQTLAVLDRDMSGIDGFIHILATQDASRPRIRWFPFSARGERQPYVAVSISRHPGVYRHGVDEELAGATQDALKDWVAYNWDTLHALWSGGLAMRDVDLETFIAGLQPLPTRSA